MLETAAATSAKIVFMWGAMQEGNIFFFLRRALDLLIEPLPPRVFLILRKPLYDCLFCMSSFWGLIFSWNSSSRHFSWDYITLLFCIGGINYIAETVIKKFQYDQQQEQQF